MTSDQEIITELKKINQQLSSQKSGPARNFFNGLFYSFGIFAGYIIIILSLAYFATQYNWAQLLGKSFESMMSQINWEKIVPQPKIQIGR